MIVALKIHLSLAPGAARPGHPHAAFKPHHDVLLASRSARIVPRRTECGGELLGVEYEIQFVHGQSSSLPAARLDTLPNSGGRILGRSSRNLDRNAHAILGFAGMFPGLALRSIPNVGPQDALSFDQAKTEPCGGCTMKAEREMLVSDGKSKRSLACLLIVSSRMRACAAILRSRGGDQGANASVTTASLP